MSIRKKGHIDPQADRKIIREEVIKELTLIGLAAESYMLDYLEKHNIDDNGDLAESIRSEVSELLRVIRLEFGSGARHGIFVHDGTGLQGPNKTRHKKPPPVAPIRRWVIRKLNKKEPEATGIAHAIKWKIYREGTKPKPYAGVTMRLIRRQAPQRIREAIERGVKRAG